MPTYQYSCTECGHFFEQFQNFSEDSLTTCPECTGRLRKVFNAVGVVFKGSGFYRTDSRSGPVPAGSSSSSGTSGSSESGTGSTPSTSGTGSTPSTSGAPSSAGSSSGSSTSGSAA